MSTCVHISIIHNSPQGEMPCSTSRKWTDQVWNICIHNRIPVHQKEERSSDTCCNVDEP